ncbi:unnamed protein product [Protopolystoma xenopodis]|uniref:Uncharacterized protein n=1 Tax=Protopolystoma xenopodis TaxID=117903 RepID=A0A448WKV6_9PLAT|nr:unnamed protein product [Protopolystoma xenopodis]
MHFNPSPVGPMRLRLAQIKKHRHCYTAAHYAIPMVSRSSRFVHCLLNGHGWFWSCEARCMQSACWPDSSHTSFYE